MVMEVTKGEMLRGVLRVIKMRGLSSCEVSNVVIVYFLVVSNLPSSSPLPLKKKGLLTGKKKVR